MIFLAIHAFIGKRKYADTFNLEISDVYLLPGSIY